MVHQADRLAKAAIVSYVKVLLLLMPDFTSARAGLNPWGASVTSLNLNR